MTDDRLPTPGPGSGPSGSKSLGSGLGGVAATTGPTAPPAGVPQGSMPTAQDFTPASNWEKIFLAVLVVLATVVIARIWFYVFGSYQSMLGAETKVAWEPRSGVSLKPGPPGFWYDMESRMLVHRGAVDAAQKQVLLGLFATDRQGRRLSTADSLSYWTAIDRLAYQSNSAAGRSLILLLIVAGVSGALGVQIRTLANFIGVACFKNTLDVRRWWPWYLLRPPLGFLLGVLAVVVVQAGLLVPDRAPTPGPVWWLAVAVLVGFGAEDFSERVRLTSLALFGKGKPGG